MFSHSCTSAKFVYFALFVCSFSSCRFPVIPLSLLRPYPLPRRHRAESLSARLASKEQELRDLKADWRESERESRAVETVASMRRWVAGRRYEMQSTLLCTGGVQSKGEH